MTNPQFTKNLLAVIRSLPADDRRWLLRQLEQDSCGLNHEALAEMAMPGGPLTIWRLSLTSTASRTEKRSAPADAEPLRRRMTTLAMPLVKRRIGLLVAKATVSAVRN
jgi:hypothetical protein